MWVIHRSLLQAVLEDLGLPQCGSGVEVTWLLGSWEPSSAKCAGKLATLGSGDMSLLGFFLASGSSATMRTEYGGGTGCLDCGDFWGARCTEKSVAMGAEDMTLLEFFSSLWKLTLREPLWLILIYYLAEGAALVGGPSLFSVQQALKEPPLLGSFSIGQLPVLSCGEREPTMMAPPPVCDSAAVPCLHGCLAFLKRHSPLWIFSLPPPLAISPQSATVHPEIALQCPCSNSQRPHDSVDLHPCPGYVGLWH